MGPGFSPGLSKLAFLDLANLDSIRLSNEELVFARASKKALLRPFGGKYMTFRRIHCRAANLDSIFTNQGPRSSAGNRLLCFQQLNLSQLPISRLIWTALGFSPDSRLCPPSAYSLPHLICLQASASETPIVRAEARTQSTARAIGRVSEHCRR